MSDYHSPPGGPDDEVVDESRSAAGDLAAAATAGAERRRRARLATAASDARVLAGTVADGVLEEHHALEVLAADHGAEPEALETARQIFADPGAAIEVPAPGGRSAATLSAAERDDLEDERREAGVAAARAQARLRAESRRAEELEAKLRRLEEQGPGAPPDRGAAGS